ncbi:unnamed protein product [Prunus armeniaca]
MALKAKLLEKEKHTRSSTSGIKKSIYESSTLSMEKHKGVQWLIRDIDKHKNFTPCDEGSSKNWNRDRKPRSNFYARSTNDICYMCSKLGHRPNECPTHNKQVNLAQVTKDGDKEDNVDDDYEEAEFANVDSDEMINLVLHRVLPSPKQEARQRNMIFHSLCTIENKVCSVIMDSGNCENLVSKKLVDYLQLSTHKHEASML